MKILVVDDDPDLLLIASKFLEKEGFDVATANSGDECLRELENIKPDLILMDITMPGMDGCETTEKIRGNPKTKDIPVVMLTVKGEKADKLKSFQKSMCDGYIVKPVEKEELIKVVKWMTAGYL